MHCASRHHSLGRSSYCRFPLRDDCSSLCLSCYLSSVSDGRELAVYAAFTQHLYTLPCTQMTSVSHAHKYSLTSVSHHLASNTPASGVMLVKSNHIRISTQPTVCFGPNTVARVDVSACFPCVRARARACVCVCVCTRVCACV